MDILKLVLKWFHMMSAIIGFGGVLYLWLVVLPLSKGNEEAFSPLTNRFGKLFGVCLVLLLGTGLYNISQIAPRMEALYNILFGIKFMLSILFFGLAFAMFHPAKAFDKLKQKQAAWFPILGLIGMLIIAMSVTLNNMRLWTQPQKPLPAKQVLLPEPAELLKLWV